MLKKEFAFYWTHSHGTCDGELKPVAWHPPPLLFLGSQQRLTFLTEAAAVAGEAKADEGVHLIDARPSVLTGAGDTVVNVCREKGGAASEVSLPLAPSPHKKPGRRWGQDPAIHPQPECSSSTLPRWSDDSAGQVGGASHG